MPTEGEPVQNEHICCLDFSEPYLRFALIHVQQRAIEVQAYPQEEFDRDGMTMVTLKSSSSVMKRVLKQLWRPSLIQALAILVMFLIISGHLVWCLERKKNKRQFNESYLDGVDDGVWWSFVTMTTGDSLQRQPAVP
eukprot:scaffold125416_cov50-Prasinocladus_malaysianus.AAC.2